MERNARGRGSLGRVGENEHLDATYQACTWLDDIHRTTLVSTQAQVPNREWLRELVKRPVKS